AGFFTPSLAAQAKSVIPSEGRCVCGRSRGISTRSRRSPLAPSHFPRHRAVPVHRARMLESPVNRNPPRPPCLHPNLFRSRRVPPNLEKIEVLAGEKVPVPFQKRLAKLLRKRLERLAVIQVVRVNRIVGNPSAYEVVICRIVLLRPLESRRRRSVNPQRLDPSVADVAGVRGPGHARKGSRNRAAIAGGQ